MFQTVNVYDYHSYTGMIASNMFLVEGAIINVNIIGMRECYSK